MRGRKELSKFEGFEKSYWDDQYANPDIMDGHCNARDHVMYLHHFFKLEGIHRIRSLAEFGYGYGKMLQIMCEIFRPLRAVGVELSEYAFDQAAPFLSDVDCLSTLNEDMLTWLTREVDRSGHSADYIDLAICMGVFQYLPDDYLERVVMLMAHKFKWLYLTAATDINYRVMSANGYVDEYAIPRTRGWYQKVIGKWFTCVGRGVWESRYIFSHGSTPLNSDLYRWTSSD